MSFSIKSLVQELLCDPEEDAVGGIVDDQATQVSRADPRQSYRPTFIEVIALDELEAPNLHAGVQYWRKLCGGRRYPRREDLAPGRMAGLLRHTALVKVIASGGDYEYRIVGDAIACAYRVPLQNRRLSDLKNAAPTTVQTLRDLFDTVVDSKTPQAIRRKTGHDAPEAGFIEAETVVLPLGGCDDSVDHLLVFSCYLLQSDEP